MNQWINWSVQHLLSPFPAQSGILVEDPWCHSTETYPQWALSMVLESRQAPKVLECKVPKASKHECSEEGAIIVETSGNCSGMGIGGSRNTTWWSIECGIKKKEQKNSFWLQGRKNMNKKPEEEHSSYIPLFIHFLVSHWKVMQCLPRMVRHCAWHRIYSNELDKFSPCSLMLSLKRKNII